MVRYGDSQALYLAGGHCGNRWVSPAKPAWRKRSFAELSAFLVATWSPARTDASLARQFVDGAGGELVANAGEVAADGAAEVRIPNSELSLSAKVLVPELVYSASVG
jgi:hypothetical protein